MTEIACKNDDFTLKEPEIMPENPEAKRRISNKTTANGVKITGKQTAENTKSTKKPFKLDASF